MTTLTNEAYLETRNGVNLVRFHAFDGYKNLNSCFSTRTGGVSQAPFDSLNLGLKTEDEKANVLQNRRRFFEAAEIIESNTVIQNQVHSTECRYVMQPGQLPETDACFTDRPGIYLTVFAADCVPVMLFHPARGVCAVAHAGWRGTRSTIVRRTISALVGQFDLDPGGLVAVIGPAVGGARYEVSEEVAAEFDPAFVDRPNGKPHVDLSAANAQQLLDDGVHEVHVSGLCTFENDDLFFSHRRSGGRTGRMVGVIGMTS